MVKKGPLVSVIIPMYNVEPYVRDALMSVSRQTYANLEILVVDDGSTDQSREIAIKTLESVPSVHWEVLCQENLGVSSARNRGMRESAGDYVICLDPDDVLAPWAIELLVKGMVENHLDVAFMDYDYVDGQDIPYRYSRPRPESFTVLSQRNALDDHLLRTRNMVAPAAMVSMKCRKAVQYRDSSRYGEDVLYVWEVLAWAKRVGYLEAPGYGYRLRPGSAMTFPQRWRIESGAKAFESLDLTMAGLLEDPRWAFSRWALGVAHVLAKNDRNEELFSWFYKEVYRVRAESLLRFPQIKIRVCALTSLLGQGLFKMVLRFA